MDDPFDRSQDGRESDAPGADDGHAPAFISDEERELFDAMVEDVLGELGAKVVAALDRMPLIVQDVPSPAMLADLGIDPAEDPHAAEDICGLHTGVAFTEGHVEHPPELPSQIHLFRVGVLNAAGGWERPGADEHIRREIRVTILHEIGHQMGLDEDDLERLGYG